MGAFTYLFVAGLAILSALYGPALTRFITVVGVFRIPANTPVDPADTVFIKDTIHCEDLHHHLPSNLLFTACEDSLDTRYDWFPALDHLRAPQAVTKARGSLHVIDPQTLASKRLTFDNYAGPFVTHGIDVITDPADAKAVYIYAINHLPHPQFLTHALEKKDISKYPEDQPKTRSQIEIFRHVLGSDSVLHIRSVWHPLVKTPNDIVATSPTAFFVTNDHFYATGSMRQLEDVFHGAKWSDTVFVEIEGPLKPVADSGESVTGNVALTGLHNNNGLGQGRTAGEVAIGSAASGALHLGKVVNGSKIEVIDTVGLDSCIDNPSYYADPYPLEGTDKSGFVLGGLSRAVDMSKTTKDPTGVDPIVVWLASPLGDVTSKPGKWAKELLFEDDGGRLRSASSAVLVGIDPKLENGEKKAWLFATGFISKSILAVKIKL